MKTKKITDIYAFAKQDGLTSTQSIEQIIKSINGKGLNNEYDTWKVITDTKSGKKYLQNKSDQFEKEGYIDLSEKDDTLFSIYVLKNSNGEKDDLSVASQLLGRLTATLLYHFPDIQIVSIRKK